MTANVADAELSGRRKRLHPGSLLAYREGLNINKKLKSYYCIFGFWSFYNLMRLVFFLFNSNKGVD